MSERESVILDRMKRSVALETPYNVLEELDSLRASNAELLAALERLKSDCALILAGKPVRCHDETLAEVESAIAKARGVK